MCLRPGTAYPEIVETCYNGWNGLEGEGAQYGYWNGKVAQNYSSNACLKKYRPGYTSASYWWERSVSPTHATSFARVSSSGDPSSGLNASNTSGVCPCFCLILLKAVSIQCARRRRENLRGGCKLSVPKYQRNESNVQFVRNRCRAGLEGLA